MTEVISVRFRGGCKTYYFDPRGVQVTAGEHVIVETAQGLEYAQCAEGNHEVPDEQVVEPFRPMVRIATDHDRRVLERNRAREKEAFDVCQKKILQHKLEMKLVRVECSFDGNKILFFFTADGRVDFRELVKDLASAFRARIELRQIGVRDEAKMLGGLGICGRPFCCAQFLDDFMPVSIKMAKTQSLSLNPTKISGTCGRLMCCLKYEQEAYEDALKRLPKNDSFVQTPDGPGNVSDVNVLKETVKVRLDEKPEAPRCYHNCEVCVLRNGKGSRALLPCCEGGSFFAALAGGICGSHKVSLGQQTGSNNAAVKQSDDGGDKDDAAVVNGGDIHTGIVGFQNAVDEYEHCAGHQALCTVSNYGARVDEVGSLDLAVAGKGSHEGQEHTGQSSGHTDLNEQHIDDHIQEDDKLGLVTVGDHEITHP